MTQNQLRYWTLEETKRSNKEQESQTRPLREAQTAKELAQEKEFYAQVDKLLMEVRKLKSERDFTNARTRAQVMDNISNIFRMFSNLQMLPTWWNTGETKNIAGAFKDVVGGISGISKLIG